MALEGFSPITISRCGILASSNLVSRIRNGDFLIYFYYAGALWQVSTVEPLWICPVISDGWHRLSRGVGSAACATAAMKLQMEKDLK
jgi:hypothetical protein